MPDVCPRRRRIGSALRVCGESAPVIAEPVPWPTTAVGEQEWDDYLARAHLGGEGDHIFRLNEIGNQFIEIGTSVRRGAPILPTGPARDRRAESHRMKARRRSQANETTIPRQATRRHRCCGRPSPRAPWTSQLRDRQCAAPGGRTTHSGTRHFARPGSSCRRPQWSTATPSSTAPSRKRRLSAERRRPPIPPSASPRAGSIRTPAARRKSKRLVRSSLSVRSACAIAPMSWAGYCHPNWHPNWHRTGAHGMISGGMRLPARRPKEAERPGLPRFYGQPDTGRDGL